MSRPRLTIDMRMVQSGGIGTYLRQLAPRVLARLPSSHICLLGRADILNEFPWTKQPGVTVVDCRAGIYTVREQLELPLKIPGDTTLFWSPHYNIPLLFRGRLLVTVHDTFHLAMPQFVQGWHRRVYSRVLFRSVRAKAAAIVCVSHFAKSELLRFCPTGAQEVIVNYNGVDGTWLNGRPSHAPRERPYLLFVGNVKPHKNLSRLLEAFQLLRDKIPHDLVVIGKREGFITGDAMAIQKASGMDRVVCVGELSHEHELLRRFYCHADALILPSLYESFGLTALEALASRCPAIVSRVGGLPEVYGDGVMYCHPYDISDIAAGIYRMVTDRPLRQRYVDAGYAVARRYDWDDTADRLVALMGRLMA